MAYKSKYYDPVKAHEYYLKHRKLKGRNTRSSTASLNEEGKVAAAEVKERLAEELKAALSKLPRRGATEQRKALREKYKEMYLQELDKIKQDSGFAKTKATKAAKTSSGSSRGSSGGSSRSTETAPETVPAAGKAEKKKKKKKKKVTLEIAEVREMREIAQLITEIRAKIQALPEEKKETAKTRLQSIINAIGTKEETNE